MSRPSLIGVLVFALAACLSAPAPAAAEQSAGTRRAPAKQAAPTPSSPVNLNSATAAQLEALPGIGPKAAQRIIEYRQKNGGFRKTEELMNVKGIGEKSFLKLKPLLTISAAAAEPPAAK